MIVIKQIHKNSILKSYEKKNLKKQMEGDWENVRIISASHVPTYRNFFYIYSYLYNKNLFCLSNR